jgi:hypothetical protein
VSGSLCQGPGPGFAPCHARTSSLSAMPGAPLAGRPAPLRLARCSLHSAAARTQNDERPIKGPRAQGSKDQRIQGAKDARIKGSWGPVPRETEPQGADAVAGHPEVAVGGPAETGVAVPGAAAGHPARASRLVHPRRPVVRSTGLAV